MASPKVAEALKQISASAEKQKGYETLLNQVESLSSATHLPNDLIAIIDALFADALGIVISRSLSGQFIKTLSQIKSNDTKIQVGEHALDVFQDQSSSFEEQNAQLRELMAEANRASIMAIRSFGRCVADERDSTWLSNVS